MDHCLFDGPTEGMINLTETSSKVAPCVDGILLSPGMLPYCQEAFNYKGAPMAIVRLNWSTTYCFQWLYKQGVTVPAFSPAEALRLGAEIALVSLTLETGSESNDAHNVEVFRKICREAKDAAVVAFRALPRLAQLDIDAAEKDDTKTSKATPWFVASVNRQGVESTDIDFPPEKWVINQSLVTFGTALEEDSSPVQTALEALLNLYEDALQRVPVQRSHPPKH